MGKDLKFFQVRVQVPGDGRGGVRKRRQVSLPGIFDTAKEAAKYRALALALGVENVCGKDGTALKQNKHNKPRCSKHGAAKQREEVAIATAVAEPIADLLLGVPLVVASPLPMQPLPL